MFERLAPFLQEYIYSQGWEELKYIQTKSCEIIFNTDKNLLISSGTASGKTEAVFLPILTQLYNEEDVNGVSVLYISPLKALINDQFLRLEDLTKESDINVLKWHGDVYSYKKDLNNISNIILQITPESLESILTKKKSIFYNAIKNIKYIVIDEIHYFMSSIRGEQLRCLLHRLQLLTNNIPRRIGLSATISNLEDAAKWLSDGTNRTCIVLTDTSKKRLKMSMNYFNINNNDDYSHLYKYLLEISYNYRDIIFANSRKDVEEITHNLTEICKKNNLENRYFTHHASISKSFKENIEKNMKNSDEPISAISTTTLELGIDVGSLDRVIQFGCPYKVSSFLQRLGRTGRRNGVSDIRFIIKDEVDNKKSFLENLNIDFLLTLAIIELYKDEKWLEEPNINQKPFSLLFHQTLACLYANVELGQTEILETILNFPPFKNISKESFIVLLRHMRELNFISVNENGKISLGVKGEQLVNNYHFFSVFETKPEYIVKTNTTVIGSITQKQKIGSKFWLAGKCWRTISIDDKNLVILVEYNSNEPGDNNWSSLGCFNVDTKLFKKAEELIFNNYIPKYLDENGINYLTNIRNIFNKYYKDNFFHTNSETVFLPWVGTKNFEKIFYILKVNNIKFQFLSSHGIPFAFVFVGKIDENKIKELLNEPIDKNEINLDILNILPIEGKYNSFIPKELLLEQCVFENM